MKGWKFRILIFGGKIPAKIFQKFFDYESESESSESKSSEEKEDKKILSKKTNYYFLYFLF